MQRHHFLLDKYAARNFIKYLIKRAMEVESAEVATG